MEFCDVYCDMDGVTADFVTPACDFFGIKPPQTSPEDQLIFDNLWDTPNGWRKLKTEWPTFWMDIDLMPLALDLWAILQPQWAPSLLSAIPEGWEHAGLGKTIWAHKHLPGFGTNGRQIVIAGKRSIKKDYAKSADGRPNLLIDDFEKNIKEWEAHGGIGVLYTPTTSSLSLIDTMLNN
jgi:hypothetical protein